MESPNLRVMLAKPQEPMGPRELADRFLAEADFVVVEGYKESDLPKIEVFRKAVHAEPLYQQGAPGSERFLAVVTDDREFRSAIPVLRFTDTAWMYRLTDIVLQGAK
jgi:molybdopterin-guanine dinucleotide biosynthesis protein B